MTLREKRYQDAINTLNRTLAQRDACLANLVRLETRVQVARIKLRRLDKAIAAEKAAPLATKPKEPELPKVEDVKPLPPELIKEYREEFEQSADDPAIPGFLRRSAKDKEAAKTILAEQQATKKAKARGRIETMKAKQRGDTKRMPLTGRAALAAIHGS